MSKTQLRLTDQDEHTTPFQLATGVADHVSIHELTCPGCHQPFIPARRNQIYCNRECQKKKTHNTARGSREVENRERTRTHYERAAWLSHDLNSLPPATIRAQIMALLEAASGEDAALRNILLDPNLLNADPRSPIGKLGRYARHPHMLNIAKMVNRFCRKE